MLIINIRYILVRRKLAPDISTYINKGFPDNQETVIRFYHIYSQAPFSVYLYLTITLLRKLADRT